MEWLSGERYGTNFQYVYIITLLILTYFHFNIFMFFLVFSNLNIFLNLIIFFFALSNLVVSFSIIHFLNNVDLVNLTMHIGLDVRIVLKTN